MVIYVHPKFLFYVVAFYICNEDYRYILHMIKYTLYMFVFVNELKFKHFSISNTKPRIESNRTASYHENLCAIEKNLTAI